MLILIFNLLGEWAKAMLSFSLHVEQNCGVKVQSYCPCVLFVSGDGP